MSEWRNRWILQLLETMDRGVDTTGGYNCHCLCLWFVSVACVGSGCVMIARAAGFGMRVVSFWSLLRGVGGLTMLDKGLDATQQVQSVCEHPLSAGGVWLVVPGLVLGVLIACRCVADWVESTRWVISATQELFSEGKGVEVWPWIVEAMALPPWETSLLPAGIETCLLPGGIENSLKAHAFVGTDNSQDFEHLVRPESFWC